MFEQILQLESATIWHYGDASSTAFPLAKIDTINQETGELNEDSALSLIVYGVRMEGTLRVKKKILGNKRPPGFVGWIAGRVAPSKVEGFWEEAVRV
jgi:hypothetical protein